MTEEMEYICFQLIANSGAAKSSFIEAIQLAKAGNLKEAKIKVEEAEDSLVEAHKIHSNLIKKELLEKNRILLAIYACRRPNGFNRDYSVAI